MPTVFQTFKTRTLLAGDPIHVKQTLYIENNGKQSLYTSIFLYVYSNYVCCMYYIECRHYIVF